jgi:hypothetical protein
MPCHDRKFFFCQSIRAFSITFVSFSVMTGHSVLPLSIFLSWQGIQYYPCLFFCHDRAFSITLVYFSVVTWHSVLPLSILLSVHQGIQYYPCLFFCQSIRAFNITFVSSPCQRQCELLPSLGVRRPLTFHILIFSSEIPQPYELKLGRKR